MFRHWILNIFDCVNLRLLHYALQNGFRGHQIHFEQIAYCYKYFHFGVTFGLCFSLGCQVTIDPVVLPLLGERLWHHDSNRDLGEPESMLIVPAADLLR